jgi:RHS repeat-associated protein
VWAKEVVSERKHYFHGDKRVAQRKDSVVYYVVGDHLGTTSMVLDGNGDKLTETRHYPYGGERWSNGTLPTDYRFTGQREDLGGLFHMGARWYDSYISRWLSADTLVPDPANPQSLNRFSWVLGNPMLVTRCPPFRIKACGLPAAQAPVRTIASGF